MKKALFMIVVLFFGFSLSAQIINKAEYFFDSDPGFGMGTPYSITTGNTIDHSTTVDVSQLTLGFHILYSRVRDNNGNWSLSHRSAFLKQDQVDRSIQAMEYFIDEDPGHGIGIPIGITPGGVVDQTVTLNLSALDIGLHIIYVRVKDNWGNWSISNSHPFLKQDQIARTIQALEYFIDEDPGHGSGTAIAITEGGTIDQAVTLDFTELDLGLHIIYVRAQDNWGNWSLSNTIPFIKRDQTPRSIVAMEYFLDSDPGHDSGTPIPITEGGSIDQTFTVDLSSATAGFHMLYVRVKDNVGNWSLTGIHPFQKQDQVIKQFTALEYFFDADPGIGNGIAVDLTANEVVDITFEADMSELSAGYHLLYLRGQDNYGNWSIASILPVLNRDQVEVEIVGGEHYFDNDPGIGSGIYNDLGPANCVDSTFTIDLSELSEGTHILCYRVIDNLGNWSLIHCDTIEVVLVICDIPITMLSDSICEGEELVFGDVILTETGMYLDTLIGTAGCDSVLTMDLTVQLNSSETVEVTICEGETYFAGGAEQSIAGTYFDTEQNANGCDSLITTFLEVDPTYEFFEDAEICKGDSILIGGEYQSETGTYVDSLLSTFGCDSILTVNLTVGCDGLAQINAKPISVFPNPFDETLNIVMKNGYPRSAHLTLRDVTGAIVFSEERPAFETTTIRMGHLAAGIYFLTIQTEKQKLHYRLVKSH